MQKLTEEQVRILSRKKLKPLYQELVVYLNKHYPQPAKAIGDTDDQMAWMRGIVDQALAFGLTQKGHIYTYVRVIMLAGEDFLDQDWALPHLNPQTAPSQQIEQLEVAARTFLKQQALQAKQETETFIQQSAALFAKQKASYVNDHSFFYGLPIETIDEAEEWACVYACSALKLGFTDDFQLGALLEVALYFGNDFFQKDWAQKILAENRDINNKLEALYSHLQANFGNPASRS